MSLVLALGCGGMSSDHKNDSAATGGGTGETEGDSLIEEKAAAYERAQRFAYGSECTVWDVMTLANTSTQLGYELRLLQRDPEPSGPGTCQPLLATEGEAAYQACLSMLPECLGGTTSVGLDYAQWPAHTAVIEIVGLAPERVNPYGSSMHVSGADASGEEVRLWPVSFYEHQPSRETAPVEPPGSDVCVYYWYLDVTESGVAVVLSWRMAYDFDATFASNELTLCLAD